MNTKNNKRKCESMQKIEQVLIEFLQTKELTQISVSDSCHAHHRHGCNYRDSKRHCEEFYCRDEKTINRFLSGQPDKSHEFCVLSAQEEKNGAKCRKVKTSG